MEDRGTVLETCMTRRAQRCAEESPEVAAPPRTAHLTAASSARQERSPDLSDAIRSHGAPVVLLRGEDVVTYSDLFVRLTGINPSHPLDLEALLACLFADPEQLRIVLNALRDQRRGEAPLAPITATAQLPDGARTVELIAGAGASWMLSVRVVEEALHSELRAVLAGCAHDLNNVLAVLAFTSDELADDEQRRAMARRRTQQLEHGRDLIRALAALSRSSSRPEVLAPGPLLARFCEVFGRSISGLSVQLISAPPVGKLRVDRVLLDRMLLNLLVNARDAAAPDPVTVSLSQERWEAERVRCETGGELDVPCVCVAVADDGPGIPEAIQGRVFERCFTTRGSQGLGLATVRQLMSEHGGAALLESQPGRGATFRLLFPSR